MFSYDPHDHERHQNLYYTDELQNSHCVTLTKKEIDNIGLSIKKTGERIYDCIYKENPEKILLFAITHNHQREGGLLIAKIDGFWVSYKIGNYPIKITNNIECLFKTIDEWWFEIMKVCKTHILLETKLEVNLTKELIKAA